MPKSSEVADRKKCGGASSSESKKLVRPAAPPHLSLRWIAEPRLCLQIAAVARYTSPGDKKPDWKKVATVMSGRNEKQCREREQPSRPWPRFARCAATLARRLCVPPPPARRMR